MKQETKHLLRRTLWYLLPYKREFLAVGLTLVLSTVIGFLQPLVIQRITDSGMMQRDMGVIITAALVLALLVLGNQAIDCCRPTSSPMYITPPTTPFSTRCLRSCST